MSHYFSFSPPVIKRAKFTPSWRKRWAQLPIIGTFAIFSIGSVLPSTAQAATIQGTAFIDMNNNGTFESCEPPRAGATIFIRNNTLANAGQGGFYTTTTDANGRYSSISHNADPFTIWTDVPWGQKQTAPVAGEGMVMHDFTIANSSDTVTVDFGIVDPNGGANTAPTITLPDTTMTVNMDSSVNFTAMVNDSDGDDICAVNWDFGDDNTADRLDANHTYTVPGTYMATLTVTDTRAATAQATITVTVENVLPTVNLTANPNPIGICNATRFTGTATDTSSDTLTNQLAFGDGDTVNALTANHTYTSPGTYTATLTATDSFGGVGRNTATVTVNNAEPTVTATFASTANPIRINDAINFTGTATDQDTCDTLTYQWDFGDGSTANTLNATHTYTVKGTYTATLTVTDKFGGVTTETVSVEVLGAPPVVKIGNDIALDVGEAFDFSGTFTDADGRPRYDYVWKFGDGNTSVGRRWNTKRAISATHAFLESGEFSVTLEVTDRDGNTGTATMTVNVRGNNTDPCATGVATVRSRSPWTFWNTPTAWNTGKVPGPNDWVLIQGGHTVVLPTSVSSATNRLQVRGICIAQNGVLQSDFNRHNNSSSRINLFAASIHNQGTIMGANGVNGSGPTSDPALYNHATNGSSLVIYVSRFENDFTGQVLTGARGGRGGNDMPYLYLNHWTRMDSQGGHGGQVEIYPAIFINNGRIQGGDGGNADAFRDWGRLVDGDARGGNGGFVRTFATNLAMSTNGATGEIRGGCGGYADGVGLWSTTTITTTITTWWRRWWWWRWNAGTTTNTSSSTTGGTRRTVQGGRGGNVSVNLGNFSGITTGCNGQTFNQRVHNTVRRTVRSTWWIRSDPTTLKMDNTTRFGDAENIVLFGGEDWTMDLRKLTEGAVTADETITLAIGKEGVIDLRGVSDKVFTAGTKLEVFADQILLDQGVTLADLADAPEIIVKPSKILYNVELSHAEHIVEEPGTTVPITVTILNSGPMVDTYDISLTDSAGWEMEELPSTVTVNSLRRSELTFDVTLPETRGEENLITVTVTSQGDPEMQAVAEIRVNVKKAERITPRNGEQADITLAIDDTITMGSELVMVANAMESLLAQLVDQSSPSADEMDAFMAQFSEDNPPSNEEMSEFLAQFETAAPTVELLTFKDDVTSRVVTQDIGDVISRIRSIQPTGGDDCPNASVAAIESALENLKPNSQIVLVTASAPHKDAAAAIAKAQENGVKVNVILTGSCGNETADKATYQRIADETGGTLNWAPKGITPMAEIETIMTTVVEETMEEVMANESSVEAKVDVWVSDPAPDDGTEPGKATRIWGSPDVWVRNQDDGGTRYQNVKHGQDNYVYVNIRNRGTLTAENTKVELYRSGASMGQGWPNGWGLVGTGEVASLAPESSEIVKILWEKDNIPKPGHYCFYVRLLNDDDPMFATETNNMVQNTRTNNNVAWRNFNVVGLLTQVTDQFEVNLGNPTDEDVTVELVFEEKDNLLENDGAKAIVDLGATLFQRWQDAGGQGENVEILNGTEVQLLATPAKFIGIPLQVGETLPITMRVDATQPMPGAGTSREYHFSAQQFINNELVGGVDYTITTRAQDTDSDGDGIKDVDDNDNDNDGIPDDWEIANGLNPLGPEDAAEDSDGDGVSNLEEFTNGTNPKLENGNYASSGIIRNEQGNPLTGVTVQIGSRTTTTDETGRWEITGLPEGEYTVTATKEGYPLAPADCALGNDQDCNVTFVKADTTLTVNTVANPRQPQQGENVTYTITVTNGGEQTATGVVLSDVLPENVELLSIEALDGGNCDATTVTCDLPDLTTGNSARVKLVIRNNQGNRLENRVQVESNEYPTDVDEKRTSVTPHLAVTMSCTPKQVTVQGTLHCTTLVELSSLAPSDATGVQLVMTSPDNVELQSISTDNGICDTSEWPTVTCSLTDLSVESADATSTAIVEMENLVIDPGLLVLKHEAKVSANEYGIYKRNARNTIFVDGIKVDQAFVIDVTGSMQSEINGVIKALTDAIEEIKNSGSTPLIGLVTFRDEEEVKLQALTSDLDALLGIIGKLKASGGGTCHEASAEAINLVIPHVKDGGSILFATDASAYPEADVNAIIEQLRAKSINFNGMITGDCSDKNSWNELP
jgi:uncharacterized repeat protein (TIGR01451 family)